MYVCTCAFVCIEALVCGYELVFFFFFIWVTGWLSHNVRGQGLRIRHIEHMCLFACVYPVYIFQFVLYWLCNHCALVLLGPQKKIKLNLLLYIFFLSTIGTDAFASSKEASLNEIHPKRTCYQKLCHKLTAPKCDSQRERAGTIERVRQKESESVSERRDKRLCEANPKSCACKEQTSFKQICVNILIYIIYIYLFYS